MSAKNDIASNTAAVAASLLLGALSLNAYGDEGSSIPEIPTSSCSCPKDQKHVLGGHSFLPNLLLLSPFPDTESTFALAAGYGSYPSLGLGLSENLKLLAAEPQLTIQFAPIARLAFSIGASGNMVSGADTESALLYGASFQKSWQIGAVGSLIDTDKLILSLALNVQFPHYLAVTPSSAVTAFNRNLALTTPDFVDTNTSTAWKPSLRFAYGLNPTFGVGALVGLTAISQLQSNPDESTVNMNLALGINADLKPSTGIPFGLSATYFRNQIVQTNSTDSNVLSFGLYETVWTQASFGVEVGFGNADGQNSTLAALNARIYY